VGLRALARGAHARWCASLEAAAAWFRMRGDARAVSVVVGSAPARRGEVIGEALALAVGGMASSDRLSARRPRERPGGCVRQGGGELAGVREQVVVALDHELVAVTPPAASSGTRSRRSCSVRHGARFGHAAIGPWEGGVPDRRCCCPGAPLRRSRFACSYTRKVAHRASLTAMKAKRCAQSRAADRAERSEPRVAPLTGREAELHPGAPTTFGCYVVPHARPFQRFNVRALATPIRPPTAPACEIKRRSTRPARE